MYTISINKSFLLLFGAIYQYSIGVNIGEIKQYLFFIYLNNKK